MQFSRLGSKLRKRIEPKLIYSPFLRLIIFNGWFQLSFAAVLLTVIAAALYLPKMWRTSPLGFQPVIHVSGLDLTQAWSLKRSARKLQAGGEYVKAVEAWQGAVAQNPADLSALRGGQAASLNFKPSDKRFASSLIGQMQWLLRMNATNRADVELIARVCDHFGWYDLPSYLLGSPLPLELPAVAEAVVIKGLFYQNRITEFSEKLEKRATQLKDPELDLYRLAYKAGWTENADSGAALAQLKRASEGGEGSDRVGHLLLRAAAQKNKIDLYAEELTRLAARNEANAADHAVYWNLLASAGRASEAIKLAEAFTLTPATMGEVLRVAQSYVSLGLARNAIELMKRLAPQFGRSPEMWTLYASILESQKEWDEMRAAARTIRQDSGVRETLWGFSYFLEGRADLGQKRDATAKVAFERAAESSYEYESLGLLVGRELTRLNYPKLALRIYETIQGKLEDSREFWDGMFDAAYATQDFEGVVKATERAYRLNPKDAQLMNRYAATLLIDRKKPEEAIQLTFQLYTRFPGNATAMINHSCALLVNGRAEEARRLMESINVRTLSTVEIGPYYLALFETYHALQMWPMARKARENILDGSLFPIQRQWLNQKEREMPKRFAEKG